MAGSGSRLRIKDSRLLKPLAPIHGRPLVSYTISALAGAGVEKITAVVGFERESLEANVRALVPEPVEVEFVTNPQWEKRNGFSVLAAAAYVNEPFILTMSDHLFEPHIIDLLLARADRTKTTVAIDRKLSSIFDLSDAMKLRTTDSQVTAIGKDLTEFDAIDTGLFVCSIELFDYLQRASESGDCGLADGIRLMAADAKVQTVDIGQAWWQDVDTPEMMAEAEFRTKSWQHRPHLAPTAN
jgi:choline kinase